MQRGKLISSQTKNRCTHLGDKPTAKQELTQDQSRKKKKRKEKTSNINGHTALTCSGICNKTSECKIWNKTKKKNVYYYY